MAIADVKTILYACIDQEYPEIPEDKVKDLIVVYGTVQKSGLHMFLSNSFLEYYTDLLTNNLAIRRFILNCTERFIVNLVLNTDTKEHKPSEYVDLVLGETAKALIAYKEALNSKNSLLSDPVQASTRLTDIKTIFENNPHYLVFYLMFSTDALAEYIKEIEETNQTQARNLT